MAKEKNADNAKAGNAEALKYTGKKQSPSNEGKGLINYLKGVRQETKKVVWPTREELTTDTVVVITTCAFFALAFWAIDSGFLAALREVLGITLS